MHILVRAYLLFPFILTSLLHCSAEQSQEESKDSRVLGEQPPSKINIFSKDSKAFLPRGVEPSAGCLRCKSSLSFAGKDSQRFEIGNKIPTLSFNTKQSWAGNIAFPDTPSAKNASLYFWLWGKDDVRPGNDLVIWMNGGPGCSSLIALSSENGPFLFESDKAKPNPYSWTTAANILYISHPVGVSFTTGIANNTNEDQISEQFALFFVEFLKVFPELANFNLRITGESYVGQFAPFIWSSLKKVKKPDIKLKGGMLISSLMSSLVTQVEAPTYRFAKTHQKVLKVDERGLKKIKREAKKCGLATFLRNYLTFPPRGKIPSPSQECSPFSAYVSLTVDKDKKFNIYNIKNPLQKDPNQPNSLETFFNNENVQTYIHAPRQKFKVCTEVFGNDNTDQTEPGDRTPSFDHSYLSQMFEESQKFIIMSGGLDGLIFADGVQLALQNLTWHGDQGFKAAPSIALYDMEGQQRAIGTNEERNVQFAIVPAGGHMLPRDQPSLSLSALNELLGRKRWAEKKTFLV